MKGLEEASRVSTGGSPVDTLTIYLAELFPIHV